jgi:hypothetical protein
MNTTLWIVQIMLALIFALTGLLKLTQPRERLARQMGRVNDIQPAALVHLGAPQRRSKRPGAREAVECASGQDKSAARPAQHRREAGLHAAVPRQCQASPGARTLLSVSYYRHWSAPGSLMYCCPRRRRSFRLCYLSSSRMDHGSCARLANSSLASNISVRPVTALPRWSGCSRVPCPGAVPPPASSACLTASHAARAVGVVQLAHWQQNSSGQQAQGRSAWASRQRRCTTAAAGSARARAAAWPAHACRRSMSFARCPAFRIGPVTPRCTG